MLKRFSISVPLSFARYLPLSVKLRSFDLEDYEQSYESSCQIRSLNFI